MEEFKLSDKIENPQVMEMISGHPICCDCMEGKHDHPIDNMQAMEDRRSDCKNVGYVDKKKYQCHCGMGGFCKEGKWEDWPEENL